MTKEHIKRMAVVWGEFVELYGEMAVKKYGPVGGDIFDSWCRKLSGLKSKDFKRGLNACLWREDKWPPELQEFMRLCMPEKKTLHKDYKTFMRIGNIKADPESCKEARAAALAAAGVTK